MCSFKILHHSESGYVIRCQQCQHIHVAFGSTVMAFTLEEFYGFKKTVEEYNFHYSNLPGNNRKQIQLPTANRSISLLYSRNELEKLSSLLDHAIECLCKEKLFTFHEN